MSAWLHFALPVLAEILFFSAAILCVFRAQKSRIYPALWQFLTFRVVILTVELAEGLARHLHWVSPVHGYYTYFFTYWPGFIVASFLILRVMHEMFRHAVRSVPGVQMMGRSIFFWAIVVSAILVCSSANMNHQAGVSLLLASGQVLARSQSVLALCMLAFLAFFSNKLGVSYGSRIFGVTFGLGLMALANLVNAVILIRVPSLQSAANLALECVYLAAVAIWCVYFLKPEPARRLVTIPTQSPLMRWNDVAQQLGNSAGQIPVSYPPTFMSGIQAFVDNVMGPLPTPLSVSARPPGPVAS